MTAPSPLATGRPAASAAGLAEELRSRDDAALTHLIASRPDLGRPAPPDITALAARALSPASIRRALDGLDTPHLRALDAATVATGGSIGEVAQLLGASTEQATDVLQRLHDLALVALDGPTVVVPRQVAEVLEPVAGLAPPHPDDPAPTPSVDLATDSSVDLLLRDAPRGARELLDRLTWGPPTGVLDPDGPLATASAWLVEHHLLREGDGPGSVVLPRTIALALRRGRLHPEATAPVLTVTGHGVDRVDAAAGARAADVLGLVEEIADAFGAAPPRVLRAGGLAVRDLQERAERLGCTIHETSLLLELMRAARLVADDGAAQDPLWAPTRHYDDWIDTDDAQRWADVVSAWRDLPRAPHLVGRRGRSGPINVWSAEVALPGVIEARRHVLTVLGSVEPGGGVAAVEVGRHLSWERPRRPASFHDDITAATMLEAEALGITSAGALSSAGRGLLGLDVPGATTMSDGGLETSLRSSSTNGEGAPPLDPSLSSSSVDRGQSAATVARSTNGEGTAPHTSAHGWGVRLPEPVDRVVLQADLTAVAPGRPTRTLGAFLRRAADVESRGGATTYRFSANSIGRLFDDGWDAQGILHMLDTSSLTPVPQPLTYLVADADRRHGRARVGAATSYLRSEDTAALDELLTSPEAAAARLRRIAPTVIVSPLAPTRLLDLLRRAGLSALAEGADGTLVTGAAAPARAATPRPAPAAVTHTVDASAVVTALRAAEPAPADAGERVRQSASTTTSADPTIPVLDPVVSANMLREAMAVAGEVWVGVVDSTGATARWQVRPTAVTGGLLQSVDPMTGRARSISLSRITGVVALPE
ncbi:MAG: helicase-associated domain-containing protein [Mobilicoccus sp.]|nr:helicase-associated domain-containing protein [Mobilicoccus sp.]